MTVGRNTSIQRLTPCTNWVIAAGCMEKPFQILWGCRLFPWHWLLIWHIILWPRGMHTSLLIPVFAFSNHGIMKSWQHGISCVGRDPQGSRSSTPGSTQDHLKFKSFVWEYWPNSPWIPTDLGPWSVPGPDQTPYLHQTSPGTHEVLGAHSWHPFTADMVNFSICCPQVWYSTAMKPVMELSRKQLCSSIVLWLKCIASNAQKKWNPSTLKPLVNLYILLTAMHYFWLQWGRHWGSKRRDGAVEKIPY